MTYKLFSTKQLKEKNGILFDITKLSGNTIAAKAKLYDTFVNRGILSINEVRVREGYSPVEGGDIHNFNMGGATYSAGKKSIYLGIAGSILMGARGWK